MFHHVGFSAVLGVFVLAFVAPLPIDVGSALAAPISASFHVGAYALLTGFSVCRHPSCMFGAAFAVLLFGALLESAQYFVPGRYFGIPDLLANASGVMIGAMTAVVVLRRFAASETVRPEGALPTA